MRTTLTIDDDIANRLEDLCRTRKESFKSIVNSALRVGVQQIASPPKSPKKPYAMHGVSLGTCRIGSLVNISDALALAEGEQFK